MGLIEWLDDGCTLPYASGFKHRLSARIGLHRVRRRKNVTVAKDCLISPLARINAREGSITLGNRSMVCPYAVVQGNVTLGKNCSVQPFSIIVGYGTVSDRQGEVRIGDNVRIASHVMIIGANHVFSDPDRPITSQGLDRKTVTIEDDVWIAGRVNILAGVTIGRGSVIGAGSVVTKDVEPYSVVVGVPAVTIKKRGEDRK